MDERDRAADGEAQTSGERGFRGRRRGERRDWDEEGLFEDGVAKERDGGLR